MGFCYGFRLLLVLSLLQGCTFEEGCYWGNIEGRVVDSLTGDPISNAIVFYSPWGVYFLADTIETRDIEYATTNEKGEFLLRHMSECEEYSLLLRKWPGYIQNHVLVNPAGSRTITMDFHLQPADVAYRIEPEYIYFDSGQVVLPLTVINEGRTPFYWIIHSSEWAYVDSWNKDGISNPEDTLRFSIRVKRGLKDEILRDSVVFEVLTTGESSTIEVIIK